MPDDAPRRTRRTGAERFAIGASISTAVIAVIAAASLVVGYVLVNNRAVVPLDNPAEAAAAAAATEPAAPPTTDGDDTVPATTTAASTPSTNAEGTSATTGSDDTAGADDTDPAETDPDESVPPTTEPTESTETTAAPETTTAPTFPDADPEAANFLLTGADNGACVDPNSPYAGAFGDREGMGERSDTIMIVRVDPSASRMAVLSFPRDLWVEIAGTGSRQRINSAYRRDDPKRLVDTIYENFGIGVDHFIQVDFCAFKSLVDAVGGIAVPFEFPARDENTGLNVPTTGCFTFDGEHALAYVRSRKYEYENPPGSGEWSTDGTSDFGRISRQQDFLRRVLSAVLSAGPFDPSVASSLFEVAEEYVVTDDELSPQKLLEFAGVMRDVEPGAIPTYQIESSSRTIGGAAVEEPEISGENMQAVLALFRGETSLEAAPEQEFAATTVPAARPGASTDTTAPADEGATATTDGEDATTTAAPVPGTGVEDPSVTTAPPIEGAPAENTAGIVPPRDVECT